MQRATINRIIQDKVQNARSSDKIKEFVSEILVYELSNLHIERPHYGRDFDSIILKHLKKEEK
jgi:hypothetical protein